VLFHEFLEELLGLLLVLLSLVFVLLDLPLVLLLDLGTLLVLHRPELLLLVLLRQQPTPDGLVGEGVLPLLELPLVELGLLGAQDGLDLVGVDDPGDIGVLHHLPGEGVTLLLGGTFLVGTEEFLAPLLLTLGPDTEPTEGTTGGELEEVQPFDAAEVDTGDVPEGLLDTLIGLVDNKGTEPHGVPPVSNLTPTLPDLLGLLNLLEFFFAAELGQELDLILGLLDGLLLVGDNKRHLRDGLDPVTPLHNQGLDTGLGDLLSELVPLLGGVDLPVPLPPLLEGLEHTTTPTHVTELTLTGPVGTTTGDTGNPGNLPTGTPGDLLGVVTGLVLDALSLPLVLLHVPVDKPDDILPQGGLEHLGHLHGGVLVLNGDGGSQSRHFTL